MSGAIVLGWATSVALGLVAVAFGLILLRLLRGPSLPDRVLALDLLTTCAIAFTGIIAVRSGAMVYLDIAIALGLIGFLATVALARYVVRSGGRQRDVRESPGDN